VIAVLATASHSCHLLSPPGYNFVIPREGTMITTIRRLGNSRGITIPKPMLMEAGLDEEAEITLERGANVLR
jgi:hypothetical protein